MFENITFPDKIEKELKFLKNSKIDREKMFAAMADIKNYPKILPHNVWSIKIINQTENVIIAEEELAEAGISTKIIVKHTIIPYKKHDIEVLNGDAEGTIIHLSFYNENSDTIINSEIKMKLKGILLPFGFLPDSNLKSAWGSVISGFEDYVKKMENNQD